MHTSLASIQSDAHAGPLSFMCLGVNTDKMCPGVIQRDILCLDVCIGLQLHTSEIQKVKNGNIYSIFKTLGSTKERSLGIFCVEWHFKCQIKLFLLSHLGATYPTFDVLSEFEPFYLDLTTKTFTIARLLKIIFQIPACPMVYFKPIYLLSNV